jgi:hypothetical protein
MTLKPPKVTSETPSDDFFRTTAISCGKNKKAFIAQPNPNKKATVSFKSTSVNYLVYFVAAREWKF